MTNPKKQSAEAAVRDIRRRTRRKFSPEEKIRIVLEGLRGEQSVSELCRREGIASNLYYRWSKDFMEAGKKQLAGDTVREATSDEVKDLRNENRELKEVVAGRQIATFDRADLALPDGTIGARFALTGRFFSAPGPSFAGVVER
jgi:transposase